jgi:hypothetical protein
MVLHGQMGLILPYRVSFYIFQFAILHIFIRKQWEDITSLKTKEQKWSDPVTTQKKE